MTTERQTKPEDAEELSVEILNSQVEIRAAEAAQIGSLIEVAKRHPRSVSRSINDALTLATQDEKTAASMFYSLPRSGKAIEGPSARLAEVMAYSWGNLRADASVTAIDRTHVTAEGICVDLEKINGWRVTVKRRITNKHGQRFNEDMIGVTSNAAISVALRNAVFKVIPRVFVDRIYTQARAVSIGKSGSLKQKKQEIFGLFAKSGISEDKVLTFIDARGLDDVDRDKLITLNGILTALKEGDVTVEGLLSRNGETTSGADDLNDAVAKAKEKTPSADNSPPDDSPEPQTDEIGRLSREKLLAFIGAELLTAFPKDGNDMRRGYMPYLEQCVEDGLLDTIDLSSKQNSKDQLVKMLVAVRERNSGTSNG